MHGDPKALSSWVGTSSAGGGTQNRTGLEKPPILSLLSGLRRSRSGVAQALPSSITETPHVPGLYRQPPSLASPPSSHGPFWSVPASPAHFSQSSL